MWGRGRGRGGGGRKNCHLLHDVDDFHRWIPSREVGIRGELECVVDGFVEYVVACSLDVLVREPLVSLTYQISVDRRLRGAIESGDRNVRWVVGCVIDGITG